MDNSCATIVFSLFGCWAFIACMIIYYHFIKFDTFIFCSLNSVRPLNFAPVESEDQKPMGRV